MLSYIVYFLIFIVIAIRLTCGRCKSKVCLVGKTALITGANSGIGYQAALDLAQRGCRVIIADKADSTESRLKIISETNNPHIISKYLDLASLKSIRKFAKDIIETEEKLHILVNNAGIGSYRAKYTEDGLHEMMQINYLGHFLLTHLLIGLLKKSSPSRIIFTSSSAAYFVKMNVDELNPPRHLKLPVKIYGNSKLCQAIASNVFAEKLHGSGVTSNAFHPGGVRSGIFYTALKQEFSIIILLTGLLTIVLGKNTEEGAQTMIHLACDKGVEHATGKFFLDCIQFIQPFQANDKKLCKEIWEKSIEYVHLKPEEVLL